MSLLDFKGKPTIIPLSSCCGASLKFDGDYEGVDYWSCKKCEKACNPLVHSDIPVKPVTSILRYLSKKLIKQATDYSNLSQWIQIQIWDYCNVRLGVANHLKHESAEEVADRIIKRVLKTYAIKKH